MLLSLVCLFFIWRHLGGVLRFLFPKKVTHRALEGLKPPETPAAARLKELGFEHLGSRSESIALLWRHRAFVFVRESRVIAELPPSGRTRGALMLTFWRDGSSALTRVGPGRDVESQSYISVGVSRTSTMGDALETHLRSERTMRSKGEDRDPEEVGSIEKRLELASSWYRLHARKELLWPAALGGFLVAGFLAFWIYGIILLS
jgi:hypothetical protein